jgi:hypothetical protein
LILTKFPQGIDSEMEAFANAHSGCPQQEYRVRAQVIVFSELLIELEVILRSERLREVLIDRRAISPNQQTFSHPAVACGQIVEKSTDNYDGGQPSRIGRGRLVFVQAAEPSEQVGIPAQLGESANVRVGFLQIGQEVLYTILVPVNGRGP